VPFVASNYNESFTYDDVGRFNQKWVQKYGGSPSSPVNTRGYSYYTNSSRLKTVANYDSGSANYLYDYYGNMVYDASKKMTVLYDWRNLPIKFLFYAQGIQPPDFNSYVSAANGSITPQQLDAEFQGITPVSEVLMLYDTDGNRVAKIEKKFKSL
jgi:hypothetical protein